MERLFGVVTIGLFAAALLTFIALAREALPHLPPEDRATLRAFNVGRRLREFRVWDHAVGRAWDAHIQVFPKSRKRQLFAALLVAAALSFVGYVWATLTSDRLM